MTQLLDKKRKLLGNKGFSLVELIIVIAIMAVLVAILVPQYLQYVDKSKQSKDDSNASTLLGAVQVAMADDATATAVSKLAADPTVTLTEAGVALGNDTNGDISKALAAALGTSFAADMKITSTKYKTTSNNHDTYTITITRADATVKGIWS